jgi:hypothetical protein
MPARHRFAFESLESRHLLSGGSLLTASLASAAALTEPPPAVASEVPSLRDYLASSDSTAVAGRWDWLADTIWYVPVENLLAYTLETDLTDATPVADQTLWFINQSDDGQITGEAEVKLSSVPITIDLDFIGEVTASGQIRIEFLSGSGNGPTTGIGQMRFVEGAWRMEMQMATDNNSLLTHWAYMSQKAADVTPAEPTEPLLDDNLLSNEWRWLDGTDWGIVDTALFGGANAGVFQIDGYRNGYFWGSGTGTQPFNVFGSVTPEGNVLFLISINGAAAQSRAGQLLGSPTGATMTLRSYDGTPGLASAWLIHPDSPLPSSTASIRAFLASSEASMG